MAAPTFRNIFSFIRESLNSEHKDFTTGNITKAVFLLAVPMILEMILESVFALVDMYFVSKLGEDAIASVALTESFITIIYSIAIGLSMAATAMVARRVGEKDYPGASRSGAQAIMIAVTVTLVISILGVIFSKDILRLMGGNESVVGYGFRYAQIMLGGSMVIMLLFMLNGIFRGAGNAVVAMKSLWIANICNIILCPCLINGYGPFPELGLEGAAIATTIGRGIGVLYQLYVLLKGTSVIKIHIKHFLPEPAILKSLINVSSTAILQFIIASASWMVLVKIISDFGTAVISGYLIAIRLMMFFLLPAWGLSNAAATLIGQNLGAGQIDRAEKSVWKTAKFNAVFMGSVSLLFLIGAEFFIGFFAPSHEASAIAATGLRIMSCGFIFYGIGMVMMNAFNGAGDSRTPTWINFFCFWCFQIPLAWALCNYFKLESTGVFLAVVIAETIISLSAVYIFRKGKWKSVKI